MEVTNSLGTTPLGTGGIGKGFGPPLQRGSRATVMETAVTGWQTTPLGVFYGSYYLRESVQGKMGNGFYLGVKSCVLLYSASFRKQFNQNVLQILKKRWAFPTMNFARIRKFQWVERVFLSIQESSIFKREFLNGPLYIFWVLSTLFPNVLHLYRRTTFELLRTSPKTGRTQKRTFCLFTKAIFLFTTKNRPLFSLLYTKYNNPVFFILFNRKFDPTSCRKIQKKIFLNDWPKSRRQRSNNNRHKANTISNHR